MKETSVSSLTTLEKATSVSSTTLEVLALSNLNDRARHEIKPFSCSLSNSAACHASPYQLAYVKAQQKIFKAQKVFSSHALNVRCGRCFCGQLEFQTAEIGSKLSRFFDESWVALICKQSV